ncbi:hypothetical protein FAZ19_05820 [Sphingobacterium alkalisoli]|uniref:Uncharacterized protein n=1 Tax=Sphingobacterium alkalisoli TaxID=1874115 RepID=A0A4U0H4C0_9SPHI|nr:hypothetical protein [Sphingobacterium alkalisoli]TJY66438.1 hypothetical protein FAZ19_05820 [Sphingobacterium alkalisoli]GGH16411.1 hypothetical protein GCM10011418_18750 [Sphingobacterium alkalisoli]
MAYKIEKFICSKEEFIMEDFWSSLIFYNIFRTLTKLNIPITDSVLISGSSIEDIIISLEEVIDGILKEWYVEPQVKKFIKRRSNYIVLSHNNRNYKIDYRINHIGRAIYAIDILMKCLVRQREAEENIFIEFS